MNIRKICVSLCNILSIFVITSQFRMELYLLLYSYIYIFVFVVQNCVLPLVILYIIENFSGKNNNII